MLIPVQWIALSLTVHAGAVADLGGCVQRAKGEPPGTAAHASRNVGSRPAELRQFPNPATDHLLPSSFELRPFWRQTLYQRGHREVGIVMDSCRPTDEAAQEVVEDYGASAGLLDSDGRQQRVSPRRLTPQVALRTKYGTLKSVGR
ncbi:hypothetical protein FB107DRAFT_250480 [Schizophyllum commune]